jgi:fumarate reductase subunit D
MAYPAGTTGSTTTTARSARAPYQWLALVVGIVYLLVGILGFTVTGFDNFTENDHSQTLLGFAVNPLHNIVHILIGLLGLGLWRTRPGARTFGWILAVGYGLVSIYGLIVGQEGNDANFLNINGADNGLHIVSTLIGLAIALWPDRDRDRISERGV